MGRPKGSRDGVARVQWSRRPDLQEAMESIDHDHLSREECARQFEERTGIALTICQVSHWREANGRTDIHRTSHRGGKTRRPVGYERKSKGYTLVKIREEADVPQTRDNWRLKHVVEWERANGPLPEGHTILFADGNRDNFALENLVAVPIRLMGMLNCRKDLEWHDRESLLACVAIAELTVDTNEIERMTPRRCRVCGMQFTPKQGQTPGTRTCPSCLGARIGGRKNRR